MAQCRRCGRHLNVQIAVEKWGDVLPELYTLWPEHWEEVKWPKDPEGIDPDLNAYEVMDKAGLLHVMTMRHEGVLVGYHISMIFGHLHHRKSKTASVDMYYITPAYRGRGKRMIQEAEKEFKRLGVDRAITHVNSKKGEESKMGRLLEILGWSEIETYFVKHFGD